MRHSKIARHIGSEVNRRAIPCASYDGAERRDGASARIGCERVSLHLRGREIVVIRRLKDFNLFRACQRCCGCQVR